MITWLEFEAPLIGPPRFDILDVEARACNVFEHAVAVETQVYYRNLYGAAVMEVMLRL